MSPSTFFHIPLTANFAVADVLVTLSGPSIWTWALLFYLFYLFATGFYHLFLSPLSSIPGPWYAAVSDVWILTRAVRFVRCSALDTLFARYGPIVRVGPHRVVFRDRDTVKSVYCVNKLEKSNLYKSLMIDDRDHSMTSLTEQEHTMRRKPYAAHYALSHVSRFQADIAECVNRLVETLDAAPRTSIDCMHLLRHLLVDVARIAVFGDKPTSMDNWASGQPDTLVDAVRDVPLRAVAHSVTPGPLWRLLARLPYKRWQEMYNSDSVVSTYVTARYQMMKAQPEEDILANSTEAPVPLMQRLLAAHLSGTTAAALTERDLVTESMAHLIAGVDTSTTTFGFLFWELSRRPDVVRKLRDELDEVVPDRRTMPNYTVLMKPAYLNAFMNEVLRMYGAVSSVLERVVPAAKDASADASLDVMGHLLPPGTIVGTQAWSMHRDPDVFAFPDSFDPERWLIKPSVVGDEDRLTRMERNMLPFGAGTRGCPGRYQAQIIMRIVTAAIVLNFDISADTAETNEKTMAPRDTFVIRPAALECKLSFTPRK